MVHNQPVVSDARPPAAGTRPVLVAGQRPLLLFRVWDKRPDAAGKLTIVRQWTWLANHAGAAWARFLRLHPDADPASVNVEIYRRPL